MIFSRKDAISLITYCYLLEMDASTRQNILIDIFSENDEYESIIDFSLEKYNTPIKDYIRDTLIGVTNEYIATEIFKYFKKNVSVIGDVEQLEKCPCCLYLTLSERGQYFICSMCMWEDDGNNAIDKYSSCNHTTISNYRLKLLDNNHKFYDSIKYLR